MEVEIQWILVVFVWRLFLGIKAEKSSLAEGHFHGKELTGVIIVFKTPVEI